MFRPQRTWRLVAPALAALALLASTAAHAGIFDDDEARRAILELRSKVAALEEQNKRQADTNAQLLDQTRRNLLDMNGQLESLRGEVAKLRGQNEQLARDVADLQRRQKDIAQGVDDRIRKLEPQKVSVDGKEFLADQEEKHQYDEALATLRGGDFDKAASALSAFTKRFPGSGYFDSARFWLGNALYGKRDYKEAIATFRSFVTAAPQHPRAPEALLAIANCQAEMKDPKGARKTLTELVQTYPKSEAAAAGKERLATLKG